MTDVSSAPGLLAGRVALVSGAGPGLGRATALALARHGADIALAARRPDNLESVGAEIAALGRRVVWCETDITDARQCERVVARTVEELGRLDIVVNNAHRGGSNHPFVDTFGIPAADNVADAWHEAMDVNLWGSLTMTRAAIEPMRAQGGGRVVMIGTMAVREVRAGQGPYAISKAALVQAARSLAVELGPSGIRVNAVLPGYIRGTAVESWIASEAARREVDLSVVEADLASSTALGSIPTEDEIAGTIVWLASDLALPVTGQTIDVNAGQWL
jgi:NAD(P)-dependent dehydrogenase (short-subunit alcohol dehydrogenase family)